MQEKEFLKNSEINSPYKSSIKVAVKGAVINFIPYYMHYKLMCIIFAAVIYFSQ